jgi:hypothetical protein
MATGVTGIVELGKLTIDLTATNFRSLTWPGSHPAPSPIAREKTLLGSDI